MPNVEYTISSILDAYYPIRLALASRRENTVESRALREALDAAAAAMRTADAGNGTITQGIDELFEVMHRLNEATESYAETTNALDDTILSLEELNAFFGIDDEDKFNETVRQINTTTLQKKEQKEQEELRNLVSACTGASLSNGSPLSDRDDLNEEIATRFQWKMTTLTGDLDRDPNKPFEFMHRVASERIRLRIETGREAKRLQQEAGLETLTPSPDDTEKQKEAKRQIIFAVKNYSLANMQYDDLMTLGITDPINFYYSQEQFRTLMEQAGVEMPASEQPFPPEPVNYYSLLQHQIEREHFAASPEEKELFDLGDFVSNAEIKREDRICSPEMMKMRNTYALEQHRQMVEQFPRELHADSWKLRLDNMNRVTELGKAFIDDASWIHDSDEYNRLYDALRPYNFSIPQIQEFDPRLINATGNRREQLEVVEAAADYLSKKWKDRSTPGGKFRFNTAMEILSRLDPERAKEVQQGINLKRVSEGYPVKEFPAPPDTVTTPITMPKSLMTNTTYLAANIWQMGQDARSSLVSAARENALDQDMIRMKLAIVMLSETMDTRTTEDIVRTQEKFATLVGDVSESPEFMKSISSITPENLQKELQDPYLGKRLMEKYSHAKLAAAMNKPEQEPRLRSASVSAPQREQSLPGLK